MGARGADWVYRANELVRRFLRDGGHAVLTTAGVLAKLGGWHSLQLGAALGRPGKSEDTVEVDLFLLDEHGLWVAECKDYADLEDQKFLAQVDVALNRTIDAARLTGAVVVVLGVTCDKYGQNLLDLVQRAARALEPERIAVHLIVNGELHEDGKDDVTDAGRISSARLCYRSNLSEPSFVGPPIRTIGFGGTKPDFQASVIDRWESELLL